MDSKAKFLLKTDSKVLIEIFTAESLNYVELRTRLNMLEELLTPLKNLHKNVTMGNNKWICAPIERTHGKIKKRKKV